MKYLPCLNKQWLFLKLHAIFSGLQHIVFARREKLRLKHLLLMPIKKPLIRLQTIILLGFCMFITSGFCQTAETDSNRFR
ncbi:MAG: hypothetical protein RIA63_11070, partial [Cyclobacteriaceae bacterium]